MVLFIKWLELQHELNTFFLYDKDVIGDECNNRGFYIVNVLLSEKESLHIAEPEKYAFICLAV